MKTPIYLKMDAREALLLSEGVCRQLGIVNYHSHVSPGNAHREKTAGDVLVPTMRVQLVETLKLRPQESVMAGVRLVGNGTAGQHSSELMLLKTDEELGAEMGAHIASGLVKSSSNDVVQVLISNSHSFTQKIQEGIEIGGAIPVELVRPTDANEACVCSVDSKHQAEEEHWKELLTSLLHCQLSNIPEQARRQLVNTLEKYHNAFSLLEGERGETDLTELTIETGDTSPKRQPARRVPFALRQELARQLQKMQEEGVIQPSSCPWASTIVLVRKKDGGLRICVDYRQLNSVTKLDTFPLPRIDDLLHQLGRAKCFTTLDLAAGYCQIRVVDDSERRRRLSHPMVCSNFELCLLA